MKRLTTRAFLIVVAALTSAPALSDNKQLLWGDTHLHTAYSFDAFANNNLKGMPETAYQYASGAPVIHPYHQARVQIGTPLDFLVVTDHAEFMGAFRHIYHEGLVFDEDIGLFDKLKAYYAAWVLRRAVDDRDAVKLFVSVLPKPEPAPEAAARQMAGGVNSSALPMMPSVEADTWNSITATADAYNKPGEFTAFIGWEWSSIPGGSNLHRVVMTSADAATAQQFVPIGTDDSPYPQDLWAWLEKTSNETGADFLAIPHNSNISKGYMFDSVTFRGQEMDPDYIATRSKWERIAEITQIKGDSETHPDLSPDDEFADFETYPFYIQQTKTDYVAAPADYVRSALKTGLSIEREKGANPYQLGVIGSTDAHTSLSSAEEDNFHGKMATDSIPQNKREGWTPRSSYGWAMSASGLAAVWAQENTRESILAAMKRREVYATSGPRIGVRFFAGWGYSEADLGADDLYSQAIAAGVPMGGELSAPDDLENAGAVAGASERALSFIVQASRDPATANLDRVQIVKGWIDDQGNTHERVFDVAWGGEDRLNADGSLKPVGNSVDLKTARFTNDIGAPELMAVWQDPEFDANQNAFYYARVLQIPTPRHSFYDAIALGQEHAGTQPDTIQERAYTSAIWYHAR